MPYISSLFGKFRCLIAFDKACIGGYQPENLVAQMQDETDFNLKL
jgi:hypothetical protein